MIRRRAHHVTVPHRHDATARTPRQSRLGDYHVLAPLARGGTAGVYLAEHGQTRERVALKVLDPFHADTAELVSRLLAEREVSARTRHPGLLHIQAADRTASGVPYLVMEYLDGESLGVLAERGRIELDAVAVIGAQIAAALGALHDAGIVHCDVKAENVFVLYQTGADAWPKIKVIDYGVARQLGSPCDVGIAGTPAYMPPEQWRGAPIPKSDVYALGCLLYELVTGEPPFYGTLPQLMTAHTERLPVRPSMRAAVDRELEDAIMAALAKDPGLRPTIGELELALSRRGRDASPRLIRAAS